MKYPAAAAINSDVPGRSLMNPTTRSPISPACSRSFVELLHRLLADLLGLMREVSVLRFAPARRAVLHGALLVVLQLHMSLRIACRLLRARKGERCYGSCALVADRRVHECPAAHSRVRRSGEAPAFRRGTARSGWHRTAADGPESEETR